MKMHRPDRARRSPRAEALESRALLAGDVIAFLDDGGNLIIIGDSADNGIDFDQFGQFSVAGVDAGGSPTRVNGEPNGLATFDVSGEGDIRLFLGGGDDVLEVGTRSDSVDPPDDLEIYAGAGDDFVKVIGDTNVADDLELRGGSGADALYVYSADVGDDLDVSAEAGDDLVSVYGARVGGDLIVRTGAGRDAVDVGFSDEFADRVVGAVTVAGHALFDLGDDGDVLEVVDSRFDGIFAANGGRGIDRLILTGNTFARRPLVRGFERRGV